MYKRQASDWKGSRSAGLVENVLGRLAPGEQAQKLNSVFSCAMSVDVPDEESSRSIGESLLDARRWTQCYEDQQYSNCRPGVREQEEGRRKMK